MKNVLILAAKKKENPQIRCTFNQDEIIKLRLKFNKCNPEASIVSSALYLLLFLFFWAGWLSLILN